MVAVDRSKDGGGAGESQCPSRAPTAVVIGAGFGGLSVAGRLARAGYTVTILEKNPVPGGRCAEIRRDGHRFDCGPSIILVPSAYEEAFDAMGVRMHEVCDLVKVDPTYTVHFHDGSKLSLTNDFQRMERQLESMERGSFSNFLSLIRQGHDHLHMTLAAIAHRNFYSVFEFFSPANAWLLLRLNVLVKHYTYIKRFFADPRLRAAFTFQDMYIGVSPYDAPATFSLLQYTEFCDGVWYCKGGMCRIADQLAVAAAESGATILYERSVREICVEGGVAKGVRLDDGSRLDADVVIANADLSYVYTHLLDDEESKRWVKGLKYTSSAICFYWGVDKQFAELETHNMFLAEDFKGSFDEIFKSHALPAEPSFYIFSAPRTDPTAAPPGQDSLFVLVPCGCIASDSRPGPEAKSDVARARDAVFERARKLGITDLEQHIKFEEVYTPETWRDMFNLEKGSCFGLSHTFTQLGYMRPHNQHATINNLFFVGCSTHPGSGLPNVLVSARLTAERIMMQEAGYRTGPPLSSRGIAVVVAYFALIAFLALTEYPLSYAGFHFVFTLPPVAVLALRCRGDGGASGTKGRGDAKLNRIKSIQELVGRVSSLRRACFWSAAVLSVLSLLWTTPWDNYLVYKGIWSYPEGRVLGTVGYVPFEEYGFFVIQTFATSLWFLAALERSLLQDAISSRVSGRGKTVDGGGFTSRMTDRGVRITGVALLALLSVLGWAMVMCGVDKYLYMGLILGWGPPVLALQFFFGGHVTVRESNLVAVGVMAPTLWLWFADAVAISLRIWDISDRYTLGIKLGPLPAEEAVFFLVTNLMVVQGALLFVRVSEKVAGGGAGAELKKGLGSGVVSGFWRAAWRL